MGLLSIFPLGLTSAQSVLVWLVLGTCYLLLHAAYNLYFSPLANVPGPFFAKISGLPSYYHALRGDRHIWIWQCHQIYGMWLYTWQARLQTVVRRSGSPIDMSEGSKVRVTPSAAVFQSGQAFRDIYGFKSNVQRSKMYSVWQRNKSSISTFTTTDLALHHRKRRILNPAFSEKSIRASEVFLQKHIDRWIELLPDGDTKDWSQPKNMSEWTDNLVFDILCDLCFGRSLNVKDPGENPFKGIPKAIHTYTTFNYPFTRSPFLGLLLWLKHRGVDKLMEIISPSDIKAYFAFIDESIAARREAEELSERLSIDGSMNGKGARQDMFHFLFQATDPDTGKKGYSPQELFAEAELLVIAGSDTTATTLSGFFFYIVRNPRPHKRLLKEIRSTFNSTHEIVSGPKLSSCKYLRACIDEAMRMAPAVPTDLSRAVLAGGLMIEGELYPAGVTVGASEWSNGRSEEYGDPNVYRPERWIVDEEAGVTAEDVARISSIFHPFSHGWTNCPGQNLAILELLMTIARTLHRFDVRAEPGSTLGEGSPELGWGRRDRRQFQLDDAYISIRDGPMIQFKKRED